MSERRSIEQALADLLARYENQPSAGLARMIEQLQAEITERPAPPELKVTIGALRA